MKSLESWLSEYGESHRHPTNQLVHKICVPAIMLSILGILWALPLPAAMDIHQWINWSTLFVSACLVFYMMLDLKYFFAMLVSVTVMFAIINALSTTGFLMSISVSIFVISWIFQFWGHKIEGKKPSFMQDLAFLLIGPLWVWKSFFRTLKLKV